MILFFAVMVKQVSDFVVFVQAVISFKVDCLFLNFYFPVGVLIHFYIPPKYTQVMKFSLTIMKSNKNTL